MKFKFSLTGFYIALISLFPAIPIFTLIPIFGLELGIQKCTGDCVLSFKILLVFSLVVIAAVIVWFLLRI
jgi:hypothetical protein